ncbi:MAG: hypothetical protein ACW7DV_11390 [Paraglaciecola chathamensis]
MNRAAVEHDFIPIDASHLLTIWQWRNSDRVRENMHYDKLITWEEHEHWFEALLQHVNRECWIYRRLVCKILVILSRLQCSGGAT